MPSSHTAESSSISSTSSNVSVKPMAPAARWGGHPNPTGATYGRDPRRQISGFRNPLGFASHANPKMSVHKNPNTFSYTATQDSSPIHPPLL
jgi:hypothetical protein